MKQKTIPISEQLYSPNPNFMLTPLDNNFSISLCLTSSKFDVENNSSVVAKMNSSDNLFNDEVQMPYNVLSQVIFSPP